ncbi:MAG TPA: alkaline phosphatase family protein, partial [Actinomycetota bacterium]|nr:alkaline phosphatase family protein [Actinomycetota bacterium]
PDTYRWRLNTFSDVVRPAVWDLLGRHELRSGVFFVPFTFPVKPLPGVMISGAFGPGRWEERSFYPPEQVDAFRDAFPEEALFGARKQEGLTLAEIADRMVAGIEQQTAAMDMAFRTNDLDFVFLVWHDTDKAAHLFWHFSELPCPDVDSPICRVYQAVDRGIGRLLETLGGDPLIIVCSDHGTYPIHHRVQTHVWLAREGWLEPKTAARSVGRAARAWNRMPGPIRSLVPLSARKAVYERVAQPPRSPKEGIGPVQWDRTKAYVGPGTGESFWLNVMGREPQGAVPPEAMDEHLEELGAALLALETPDGEKAVQAVWRREDLYHGPHAGLGPDLVAETTTGTMFAPSVKKLARAHTAELITIPKKPDLTSDGSRPLGYHQRDGVVIVSGPGIAIRDDIYADVTDVTPTILRYLDLPAPRDLDGRAIEDAFVELPKARWSDDEVATTEARSTPLTADEEADISEHLRALGYLE